MRTTVTLVDTLHEGLRRRAFDEHRSFSDVLNATLERGLHAGTPTVQRTFGVFAGKIRIVDDFDDELPEVIAALDEPMNP
ncbi:MAG: hypothetical protein JST73_02090 [Actinobacteria bacterium]|nr:hypothetical protein [Actinomycetota bacterium]